MPFRPDDPGAAGEPGLAQHAARIETDLRRKILPYWFDTAQDLDYGGYLLGDDGIRRTVPDHKQLVSQARLLWVFSHAQRLGYSDARRCYLAAAEHGRQFLSRHFLDPTHGGYVWQTDRAGRVVNDHKNLYGQAFVILALTEYHLAASDAGALHQALQLAQVLQRYCRDTKHGGWREHFYRDWRPRIDRQPAREVDMPGWKGGNAHMHLMEALAELYDVCCEATVREALSESLRCNTEYFYPADASQACQYRS